MLRVAERLIEENDLREGEGTLYLEITRGVAPRAHQFPDASVPPTVFAFAKPFVPPMQLRAAGVHTITAPDIRWHRCDIKTIQLLPNVMAKQQASERNAFEAILIRDGIVTEASHSNVMAVLDGELRTHPLNHFILGGITRDVLLELARAAGCFGRAAKSEAIRAEDLARVSELFLTGTTLDVTPIIRVDDVQIRTGTPGPIGLQLGQLLAARMDAQAPRASVSASR